MQLKAIYFITLLAPNIQHVVSFLPQQHVPSDTTVPHHQEKRHQQQHPSVSTNLSQQAARSIPRGGSALNMSPSSMVSTIVSSMQTGPWGILALSAVTWSVVLPLTLYKKIYGIGVAYGFSVAAAGLTMLKVLST
ncbi:unnamed protein product, partial [Cylindrotheca closterium]